MINHPLREEPSLNAQSELRLTQLHSLSLCPVSGHQREEISTSPSAAPLEEIIDCDEFTPKPSFLQADKSSDKTNLSFIPFVVKRVVNDDLLSILKKEYVQTGFYRKQENFWGQMLGTQVFMIPQLLYQK